MSTVELQATSPAAIMGRKRLFVTGKLWPQLFEIELTKPR